MPKRENLTGQIFGQLTVLRLDEEKTKEKGRSHWICECNCDNKTLMSVLANNLKRGNTSKCKYCKSENLLGKKFNKLTVIKRVIDNNDHVKWRCQCECGNIIEVRGDSIKSGHTKSCGCLQRNFVSNLNFKDLTGKRYGKLTVIERSDRKNSSGMYYWFCDCDCGSKRIEVDGHNLVSRGTQSCGCIKSKGEEKIAKLLSENNIIFEREYIVLDYTLSTGGHPRFDFAILDETKRIKYFIEYQGEQHYIARGSFFTEEAVAIIQQRDKEKLEYCKKNNIPIIYIDYKDYQNFTIKDLLI